MLSLYDQLDVAEKHQFWDKSWAMPWPHVTRMSLKLVQMVSYRGAFIHFKIGYTGVKPLAQPLSSYWGNSAQAPFDTVSFLWTSHKFQNTTGNQQIPPQKNRTSSQPPWNLCVPLGPFHLEKNHLPIFLQHTKPPTQPRDFWDLSQDTPTPTNSCQCVVGRARKATSPLLKLHPVEYTTVESKAEDSVSFTEIEMIAKWWS